MQTRYTKYAKASVFDVLKLIAVILLCIAALAYVILGDLKIDYGTPTATAKEVEDR